MDDPTLEQHIRQYIESQTGEQVVFSWQGGEPTLMGLPFYARVVELQTKYAKPGQRIENDLQTNGIALDDEWITFLKKNNLIPTVFWVRLSWIFFPISWLLLLEPS